MKKFYDFVVARNEAKKGEEMIRWFSDNVRTEDHDESVRIVALLDEKGLSNVISALKS